MKNLQILLEEVNKVDTLNQRLTIECDGYSVRINDGEAIVSNGDKSFTTTNLNQFHSQVKTLFNVQ